MYDSVMYTYKRFPIVLEKGEGCRVWDENGKKYLDFAAGIAVNSLGHAHPRLCAAIAEQAGKLIHVSNYYWTRPLISLADKLVAHGSFDRAFFCNSGAEAIEGAMKLARRYANARNPGCMGEQSHMRAPTAYETTSPGCMGEQSHMRAPTAYETTSPGRMGEQSHMRVPTAYETTSPGRMGEQSHMRVPTAYETTSPGRFEIIAVKNSFHGRTFAALTATGQDKYKKGFGPLMPGILHAEFNDFGSLLGLAGEKTCAVLLEPIQGEGGIHPADAGYLEKVREFCDERDIVLIFDEVQCGVGRTGRFFAHELYGVSPDVVCMAKGLAGGLPIGAMLAKEKFASVLGPGDHASTFGGGPLVAAAANVVLDELFDNGLLEHVQKVSGHLRARLEGLKADFPSVIKEIRGVGLLMGAEFAEPVGEIVDKCVENGLLVINAGERVLRFAPPLVVGEEDIDEGFGILEKALYANLD